MSSASGDRRRHRERAARRRLLSRGHHVGLLEIDQNVAACDGVALSGFAQLDRARRSVQQFDAHVRLEEGDPAAYGSLRLAELASRPSETALVERSHEDLHGIEPIHRVFPIAEH